MGRSHHNDGVLLVDHQAIYRQGLRLVLAQAGLRVVAEAASSHQALRAFEEFGPGLVLIEARLPGVNGLVTASFMRRVAPALRVIILGQQHDPAVLASAIRVGAMGFIEKSIEPDEAVEIVRLVQEGENVLQRGALRDPAIASLLVGHLREGSHERQQTGSPDLSPRELEVLDCLLMGYSNRDIGEALFITEQTVKNHMTSVLRKLSVNDRVAALRTAMARGWSCLGMPALVDDPVISARR